jgi:hypothetical protein
MLYSTDSDSNILKIYRMLDRNGDDQFHYYQPGIGTYVTKADGSMTRTSRWEKFQSWYAKAKDSAIGTSFDLHVMAGYRVSKHTSASEAGEYRHSRLDEEKKSIRANRCWLVLDALLLAWRRHLLFRFLTRRIYSTFSCRDAGPRRPTVRKRPLQTNILRC